MKRVKIAIKSARNNIEEYKKPLKRMHFKEAGEKYVKSTVSKKEVEKAKAFCKRNGLKFFYDNEYGERSKTYRQVYFKNNKPNKNGKYRCVYCGCCYPKEKITIDHIYPVAKVSSNLKLQKKIKRKGITSLNDPENLVAACWSCNMYKSDKMGKWIKKAQRGKNETLWKIRWAVRGILLCVAIYLILCLFIPSICPPFMNTLAEMIEDIGKDFPVTKILGSLQ